MKLSSISLLIAVFFTVPPVHGQDFTIQTQLTVDGFASATCSFGLRETAHIGLDDFDIPAPPPAPDAVLDMIHIMVFPPESLPNRWLADFRSFDDFFDDETETWMVEFTCGLVGTTAVIQVDVPPDSYAPDELWLHDYGIGSVRVDVPGSVVMFLDSATRSFIWEFRGGSPIATESRSWGGIKGLYR